MKEASDVDGKAVQLPRAQRLSRRSILLAVLCGIALYIAMAARTDFSTFGKTVMAVPPATWLALVSLSVMSYLLRFMRWHRFLQSLGHRLPPAKNLEIYLAGFALTLTPGKVGESVRSVCLYPYGVPYAHSIATLVAERFLDLMAVGGLACLVVFLYPQQSNWIFGALSACIGLLLFFRTRVVALLTMRLARGQAGNFMSDTMASMRFLLSGRRLAEALLFSAASWCMQGISLFIIVNSFGYQFGVADVIGIYCLSILAGAASFIPGGLGATEVAISFLLTSAGMANADAVAASLLSRGATLWLAVGIGIGAAAKLTWRSRPA
jgi:uncharacterized protein (TIRG00374 family)